MRIEKNNIYFLEALVTNKQGKTVSGLTVTYEVFSCEDNSLLETGTLIDLENGVYQGAYLFSELGQYRVLYHAPNNYTDTIETVIVVEPVNCSEDKLDRILGLSQHNYRIFGQKHDKQGNLTFAKIRLYHTPEDLENQVNHFAEYEVNTVYSKNNVSDYSVKKIL